MIEIGKSIVSLDVFKKKFVCDLAACKGACCVHGDSGAPLDDEEAKLLEDAYPKAKKYMTEDGIAAIETQGSSVIDTDGDLVTPLVYVGGPCAYVYYEEDGTAKCAVEKAYLEGENDWKKPLSCHLYPIRIKKYTQFEAVQYHEWDICEPACACGEQLQVPVYAFLKEPLIRKYGEDWYKELQLVAQELKEQKII